MRAVARVFAFGLGLAAGLLSLLGASHFKHGLWLPLALAIVLAALFYGAPWVRSRGLAGPFSAATGFGVGWGWLLTSGSTVRRFDFAFLPTALMGLIAFAAGAVAFGTVLRVPVKQRSPAWRLLVLTLMAWIVAIASSSAGGASPMLRWLTEHFGMRPQDAHTVVFVLRKTVHFTFYGSVGWVAWSAAHAAKCSPSEKLRFGLMCALSLASFDEIRQITSAGRTGSGWDVVLDMAGAITFTFIAHFCARLKSGGESSKKGAASASKRR